MKYFCFFIILLFSNCGISDTRYNDLKKENTALQRKVDSLSSELNDLKYGSKNLLEEAKSKNNSQDFISAKKSLTTLIEKYPVSAEAASAKSLLKTISPKAENQLFSEASKTGEVEPLKNYISEYPKGKYYTKAISLIKKYQKRNEAVINNTDVTANAATQKKVSKKSKQPSKSSGGRIGAICCDGTRSYATGRGACSHHGGVCEWLYE